MATAIENELRADMTVLIYTTWKLKHQQLHLNEFLKVRFHQPACVVVMNVLKFSVVYLFAARVLLQADSRGLSILTLKQEHTRVIKRTSVWYFSLGSGTTYEINRALLWPCPSCHASGKRLKQKQWLSCEGKTSILQIKKV